MKRVRVFSSPCHTKGHVLYYFEAKQEQQEKLFSEENMETVSVNRALFTGDTIFIGGVGKFFEGTAEQMARNIAWVKSLPPTTAIFCGHDYLESNIKFALGIEPENPEYKIQLDSLRSNAVLGTHMLPSTVARECKANVFFRHDALLPKFSEAVDSVDCLRLLRKFKDEGKSL